ncbi:MAG: aminoglycoside adenylyltransferase domain-containing protein [Pseudomonadota bacterium]
MQAEVQRAVEDYLNGVALSLQSLTSGKLIGLYLHGSAVQEDFDPERSDIDILGVLSDPLSPAQRDAIGTDLSFENRHVPAFGLELVLCTAQALDHPQLNCTYDFALSTGAYWGNEVEAEGTTSDILIWATLCRQDGVALVGKAAKIAFGPIPSALLRKALIAELEWHENNLNDGVTMFWDSNAVLNAARSVYAAKTSFILSKKQGGEWWLKSHPSETIVVDALARRNRKAKEPIERQAVQAFLQKAKAQIETM